MFAENIRVSVDQCVKRTNAINSMRGSTKFCQGGGGGVQHWQRFFSCWDGERIEIAIKSGPSSGVSLACRYWPTIEFWLGSFVIFRGSGSILLGNPIFPDFSGGWGSVPPVRP